MQWPEKPTCHGANPMGFGQPKWRPADPEMRRTCDCGYEQIGPYGESFRTCSHCGSIHPEDLVRVLQAGAALSGSDWKYGYPHKFYVEGIPNTLAGRDVDSVSSSQGFDHSPGEDELAQPRDFGGSVVTKAFKNTSRPGWWVVHHRTRSPAPAAAHAKFYTDHLEDDGYDAEAHDLILQLVSRYSGIVFERKHDETAGRECVVYRAPYHGYQRA